MDAKEIKRIVDQSQAAVAHLPPELQPAAFHEVFQLLTANARGTPPPTPSAPARVRRPTSTAKRVRIETTGRVRRRQATPSLDRNLNLHPKGKQSLKQYYEAKKPHGQDEQNVVFVSYLQNVAALEAVGIDQVYTSYREVGARTPSNLRNSLAVTSSRKGWIDTGDADRLVVTPRGENVVNHDLPRSRKP